MELDNFNDSSVWLRFNHDSEKDSMSKSAYSAVIRSSFGTKLWMFRWRNAIDEENIALILEVIDKSLMLDCTSVIESVGGFGPGLVFKNEFNFLIYLFLVQLLLLLLS